MCRSSASAILRKWPFDHGVIWLLLTSSRSNSAFSLTRRLVPLPSNFPMLILASRTHDELFTGKLVGAWQVFANERPNQCTLHVKGEGVEAFIHFVAAIGSLIAALRILLRSG